MDILGLVGGSKRYHTRDGGMAGEAEAVPPSRSVFPDYGPCTDFFEEIGPYLVRILCEKSVFFVNATMVDESSCYTIKQSGQ